MRFRTKALAKRRQAEALDRLPEVAKPRGWLAAVALGVLAVGALVFLLAGTVPRQLAAGGVLSSPGGLIQVQSDRAGRIEEVLVSVGQMVTPTTPVAALLDQQRRTATIDAGFSGTVLEVLTGPGRILAPGSPVITLAAQPGGTVTRAYLFLPQSDAGGVAPGMSVDLAVSTAPQAEYGSLRGRVASVSAAPITPQDIDVLLANDALAQQFMRGGPPVLATVTLTGARTPTGLSWSSGKGPSFKLRPGALVHAEIQQGSQKVLDLVLGHQ